MKIRARVWLASEKTEPPAPTMKTESENDTEPDADRGGVARRDGHPYGDEGRRRKVARIDIFETSIPN